eukprot:130196_1
MSTTRTDQITDAESECKIFNCYCVAAILIAVFVFCVIYGSYLIANSPFQYSSHKYLMEHGLISYLGIHIKCSDFSIKVVSYDVFLGSDKDRFICNGPFIKLPEHYMSATNINKTVANEWLAISHNFTSNSSQESTTLAELFCFISKRNHDYQTANIYQYVFDLDIRRSSDVFNSSKYKSITTEYYIKQLPTNSHINKSNNLTEFYHISLNWLDLPYFGEMINLLHSTHTSQNTFEFDIDYKIITNENNASGSNIDPSQIASIDCGWTGEVNLYNDDIFNDCYVCKPPAYIAALLIFIEIVLFGEIAFLIRCVKYLSGKHYSPFNFGCMPFFKAIWVVITIWRIIMQFLLDASVIHTYRGFHYFYDYRGTLRDVGDYGGDHPDFGWINYQCYGHILINSANLKVLCIVFCQLILLTLTSAEQDEYGAQDEQSDMGHCVTISTAGIKNICVFMLLFLPLFSFLFTHMLIFCLVYCWIWISLLILLLCCLPLLSVLEYYDSDSWYERLFGKFFAPIFWGFVGAIAFCFLQATIDIMIYLYDGKSYVGSMNQYFTEGTVEDWINCVLGESKAFWNFFMLLSWIF